MCEDLLYLEMSMEKLTSSSPLSSTIGAALKSLSGTSNRTIFIYPGTYNEQVNVTYGGPLTIYGSTTEYVHWI